MTVDSTPDITMMLREWCDCDGNRESCVHCEAATTIDRLRAIKKSDDGAYEHVVEIYHDAAEELTIALARVATLELELDRTQTQLEELRRYCATGETP